MTDISYLEEFKQILDKHMSEFINQVKETIRNKENRRNKNIIDIKRPFPMLNTASPGFYIFRDYEERLVYYIYQYFLRDTIEDAMRLHNLAAFTCDFSSNHALPTFEWAEKSQYFDYIIQTGKKRIAYRYKDGNWDDREIRKLMRRFKLCAITIIEVIDPQQVTERKRERKKTRVHKGIQYITLEDFFREYFSMEEYREFIEKMRHAISTAYSEFGFQTMPQLTTKQLSKFKIQVLDNIKGMDFQALEYKRIDHATKRISSETLSISDTEYKPLLIRFKDQEIYKALGGKQRFCKELHHV